MMKKLMLIISMLTMTVLWTSTSQASLPPAGSNEDLQTISQWAQHLNTYYTDLSVKPNVSNPSHYRQVLRQLDQLEGYMRGETSLQDGELTRIACDKCVCVGCRNNK